MGPRIQILPESVLEYFSKWAMGIYILILSVYVLEYFSKWAMGAHILILTKSLFAFLVFFVNYSKSLKIILNTKYFDG